MKISKREKIILGLTALALIYAGIVFFFSGPKNTPPPPGAGETPAREFVTEVVQSIALHSRTATEQIILEKAQAPWPSDPFITTILSPSEESNPGETPMIASDSEAFNYTGYVEIGAKRLAIINGEEYETGDRVSGSPFTVQGITPEQVLLGDAGNRIRVIPMVDDSAP
jgi:hypothetical protein